MPAEKPLTEAHHKILSFLSKNHVADIHQIAEGIGESWKRAQGLMKKLGLQVRKLEALSVEPGEKMVKERPKKIYSLRALNEKELLKALNSSGLIPIDHIPKRKDIHKKIISATGKIPGTTAKEISSSTGLNYNLVTHVLDHLVEKGDLEKRWDGKNYYYMHSLRKPKEEELIEMCKQGTLPGDRVLPLLISMVKKYRVIDNVALAELFERSEAWVRKHLKDSSVNRIQARSTKFPMAAPKTFYYSGDREAALSRVKDKGYLPLEDLESMEEKARLRILQLAEKGEIKVSDAMKLLSLEKHIAEKHFQRLVNEGKLKLRWVPPVPGAGGGAYHYSLPGFEVPERASEPKEKTAPAKKYPKKRIYLKEIMDEVEKGNIVFSARGVSRDQFWQLLNDVFEADINTKMIQKVLKEMQSRGYISIEKRHAGGPRFISWITPATEKVTEEEKRLKQVKEKFAELSEMLSGTDYKEQLDRIGKKLELLDPETLKLPLIFNYLAALRRIEDNFQRRHRELDLSLSRLRSSLEELQVVHPEVASFFKDLSDKEMSIADKEQLVERAKEIEKRALEQQYGRFNEAISILGRDQEAVKMLMALAKTLTPIFHLNVWNELRDLEQMMQLRGMQDKIKKTSFRLIQKLRAVKREDLEKFGFSLAPKKLEKRLGIEIFD